MKEQAELSEPQRPVRNFEEPQGVRTLGEGSLGRQGEAGSESA